MGQEGKSRYYSDHILGNGEQVGEFVRDNGRGMDGLHFYNLHDENWDQSGERVDLATGMPYDNSTYTGAEDLRIVDPNDPDDTYGANLLLTPDNDDNDEAARWLAAHATEVASSDKPDNEIAA